jgi:hypothetical protein
MAPKSSKPDIVVKGSDTDTMLDLVSYKIYESLAAIHDSLILSVGEKVADDIMINAVSANLGHIIGQLDAKSQKKYATLVRQSVKDHTLLGTMSKDMHLYGDIGHA